MASFISTVFKFFFEKGLLFALFYLRGIEKAKEKRIRKVASSWRKAKVAREKVERMRDSDVIGMLRKRYTRG